MFYKYITLYCILSGTNAARIYILSEAILYQDVLRVFDALGVPFEMRARDEMPPSPLGGPAGDTFYSPVNNKIVEL